MLRSFATALALTLATSATAQTAEESLAQTIATLEAGLDARIGVVVTDTATGWTYGHRPDERFLMASTFKAILCGAIMERADAGTLDLAESVAITEDDLLDYAPVAEQHVGGSLTIADLCLATLDQSDNTAANLLLQRLGGPEEVTAFVRRLGDDVTRLDRTEPGLNAFVPGDPRDTTSPAAMVATWQAMLLGPALSPRAQERLVDWMSLGGVTGALLRASAPDDWVIVDKSGAGDGYTRNLVGMVIPPERAPWFFAIYLSDSPADFRTRNEAVARIGAAVVEVIRSR